MILIFFSWIVLLYFFLGAGITTEYLLGLNTKKITLTILLGMVFQTVLLTICAFFTSIGLEIFIANFILTTILAIRFRKKITEAVALFLNDFKAIPVYLKIISVLILVSALFKCAQPPFILDNESYYIQTIKWLNEYGFVKGLANLNIALGQTSGWHILQSGFNFHFITDRINDINGLLVVVCCFYFITEFDKRMKEENQWHWIGIILLFNLLSFQFINSPSPDLPLFILSQIVFYLFLEEEKKAETIKIITILLAYLTFIKITILPLGLLLIYLFYKEKKDRVFIAATLFIFGFLWVAKNSILTGYPLYSLTCFPLDCDWVVPEKLIENINYSIRNHEFLGITGFKNISLFEKFIIWIQFDGINRVFNVGIVVLFLIAPFTKKIWQNTGYRILYLLLLVHFITIFMLSPQFRFFLAEFIFLSALVCSDILNRLKINQQLIKVTLTVAVLLPVFLIYFINLKSLTTNKLNQDFEKISFSQIYLPEKNSKYSQMTFDKARIGNLDYYSPHYNFFIYGAADGPLPCINKQQLDYFKKRLKIIPQLRKKSIQDGFYSKKIKTK